MDESDDDNGPPQEGRPDSYGDSESENSEDDDDDDDEEEDEPKQSSKPKRNKRYGFANESKEPFSRESLVTPLRQLVQSGRLSLLFLSFGL